MRRDDSREFKAAIKELRYIRRHGVRRNKRRMKKGKQAKLGLLFNEPKKEG